MKVSSRFLGTIALTLVLLGSLFTYIFTVNYRDSTRLINQLGESNMEAQATIIDDYLNKGLDVLWVTADTVNYMLDTGRTNREILDFLTAEAEHETEQIDENFTGIYGCIRGEYLDGIGWVPPDDYVPETRDWYIAAIEGNGKPVIVAPYLDAQTNTIMISVSMMLADGKSVVSLDIALNEIQNVANSLSMGNKGYGFIIDRDGLVIAHFYEDEKGKVYPETTDQEYMLNRIFNGNDRSFEAQINGEKCTVFSMQLKDEWYVVIVTRNALLFEETKHQLGLSIAVAIVVTVILVVYCYAVFRGIRISQEKENETNRKLNRLNENIVRALAFTIDAKDKYTSGHSKRVADYSLEIAKRMGKSEEEQNVIYKAGLLHDIGKIRVPEEVINKPGKLTDEEYNQIKIHPVSGFHILKDIQEDERVSFGAKYHHERFDGFGYPNGLEAENIPEIARIIGVADAYDAMASNRSYRKTLPQEVVRSEIEKGKGKQFDPEISEIMLRMIDEDKEYKLSESPKNRKVILTATDDGETVNTIRRIFEITPEYDIVWAKNKEETLDYLEKETVHLVLLDLVMSDIGGFELYELIREKSQVPVVLMTEDKSRETLHRANMLGIDDYAVKPLKSGIFFETVYGIISGYDDE